LATFAAAATFAVVLQEPAIDADRVVRLADGRRIGVRCFGAAAGQPVLCLHGTPGSGLKFRMADKLARELGLSLYCPDRWGYGLSSPPPREPSLGAFAADMDELADALGFKHFSIVGISGGGPFAAAVAAALPSRVARLALVSPVGPIAPEKAGADGAPEIGRFHRFTFTALPRIPGGVGLTFAAFRLLLTASPRLAAMAVATRAHSADRQVFADRAQALALAEMMRTGLKAGVGGPVLDMKLFARPWDVDLGAVQAETRLWLGLDDRNVPIGAARRLAYAIPNATLSEIAGAGHFWILQNYDQIFSWLSGRSEAVA